ncbi:MAG: adhesion protein FadA [Fusobacteriaceae bacterium]|jgi:bisphosphoglycerate-dependent phosphoglycerate mutase|nr:adhesion protein FadA [Fusobacteriaceae bacterium]
MKKLLLVGCILLAGVAAYGSDIEASYADLEDRLAALQAEEKALYEARKSEALAAQDELNKAKKMYAEVSAKEKALAGAKKGNSQYGEILTGYKEIKKELEATIKEKEKVIADFNALSK